MPQSIFLSFISPKVTSSGRSSPARKNYYGFPLGYHQFLSVLTGLPSLTYLSRQAMTYLSVRMRSVASARHLQLLIVSERTSCHIVHLFSLFYSQRLLLINQFVCQLLRSIVVTLSLLFAADTAYIVNTSPETANSSQNRLSRSVLPQSRTLSLLK